MRLLVRRWIEGSMIAMVLGIGSAMLPAHAQSDQQVRSLVEALRQAAPQTGNPNDGLYSDWQIQAPNIPRWSEACIGRALSPQEFEADLETARNVLVCVMRDVLQEEYRNSGSNEAIAVRRAASWWMTGDPSRYDTGETATYTQKVLSFYQQQSGQQQSGQQQSGQQQSGQQQSGASSSAQPSSTAQPGGQSGDNPAPTPSQSTPYDRYMRAGYDAAEQKDYEAALLHFQRALDERPNDTYAQRAIQNMESYRNQSGQNQSGQGGAQ